jgi:hypothetical protein
MSELQILFAVFVVLYLLQCVAWVPQDCVAFRATLFSGWKQELEGFRLAAARIRGVPGNPLPPLRGVAVCQPPLVAVSPLGAARYAAGSPAYLPFEGMREITVSGKDVRIGGNAFVSAGSPAEAARLAAWLENLRTMPEKKRAQAIEKRLAAALDFGKASERFAEFERATRILAWACTALFAYLFLFLPLIIDAVGLSRAWPVLLAVLVVMVGFIGWQFRRAHKQLHPEEGDTRWTALMTIMLSPVAAIRANDVVLRDLFASFHPLATARVLCPPDEFRRVAAQTLRDITFPIPATTSGEEDPGAQCESWFRERLSAAIRRFLIAAELQAEALLAPPAPSSPHSVSYCPRCCQQYALPRGACADCGGVPLLPL